jgi:subtilisin family serine protease/subtilisin-like proprotein convertase family protein
LSAQDSSYLVRPDWFEQFETADPLVADYSEQSVAASNQNGKTSEWIVQFDDAATSTFRSIEDARELLEGKHEFTLLRGLGRVGQVLISTPSVDHNAVSKWLSEHPHVAYFEPNLSVWSIDAVPNDGRLSDLWGLNNTGQSSGTVDADIDATEAWDVITGSANVVVGVIDTGVDYNHPDLAANIWRNPGEVAGNGVDDDRNGFVDDVHGYDFVNNDGDPMDDEGHGTHVSGTIAAVGDNGIGITGVNWSSSIMGLKFLDAGGSGSTANALRAVNYAMLMRQQYGVNVRVTNNSWGGGGFNQSLREAIAASGNAGILFVAAAGNNGEDTDTTPHYPSNYDVATIISVAATDRQDALARFSNFGGDTVDIAAPGVSIVSTFPSNSYREFSGTSMATPHVAGVAALAWALSPSSTVSQIRDAIVGSVDRLAALDGRMTSAGRLNARATLDRLGMNVAGTVPAAGEAVSLPPTEFRVTFSHDLDPLTVAATDLKVNGISASSVTIVDGHTAAFSFASSPVTVEGPQTMQVPAGSVARKSDADPVRARDSVFYFDTLPTAIATSDPAQAATLAAPPSAIVLNFNEAINQATVGVEDLELDVGIVTAATPLSATAVRYEVRGLVPDGVVAYTLKPAAITDAHGNPTRALGGSFTIDDPLIDRYRSTNVPRAIIDRGTVTSTIQVSSALTIADVDVSLDITHTFDGDLDVFLVSPNGTRVQLFTDVGGAGANFVDTVLDDEAATAIQAGSAPFSGRFRPEAPLSVLDGSSTVGTWTLEIRDTAGADVGTLDGWELIVRQAAEIPPRISSISPLPTENGTTWASIDSISVEFSEAMQPQSVNAANWELREAGLDQRFDTPDDVLYSLAASPPYAGGSTATLSIAPGALLPGRYRFKALATLVDSSGFALDGNGDGTGGDAFVRHFSVISVPADRLEPNDGFAQATDLGAIGNRTETNLSIHAVNDDDYYRFTATMTGTLTADVLFSHMDGDINAALYDANQTLLRSSASTGDNERIVWNVVADETYCLRVDGHERAINPSYSLQLLVSLTPPGDRFEPNDSFAAAADLGALGNRSEAALSIHFPDNDDYYRFTASMTGTLAVDVVFSHAAGDIEAALYDASQTRLTYSDSRNNDERIVWNVTAGQSYYLLVEGYDGATNPNYALQLLVSQAPVGDRFEPNDSFSAATDLGALGARTEASLSIHASNNDDYYRFTAAMTGSLTADALFRHAAGDIDMTLFDANLSLLRSSGSASDNERIGWSVVAGQTYYLRVYGYDGATNSNYSLQLLVSQAPPGDRFETNDNFLQATDLGVVTSRTETNLSIHFPDNDDYYRFTPEITGVVTAEVLFSNSAGDIDTVLFDANQNELGSSATTSDNERIVLAVTAGQNYYLHVYGFDGETNPNYTLRLVVSQALPGDRFEANDTFAQATDLGVLGSRHEPNLSIHLPGNDDYYRFTPAISGTLTADVFFTNSLGDLDVTLYSANRTELRSAVTENNNERIAFNVVGGQIYYLHIYGFSDATNPSYTLTTSLGIHGTPGNDTRYVRMSSDGARLEVFNVNPPNAASTPIFTWPVNASEPLAINTQSGNDIIVVDIPVGATGPAAGLRIDTGAGSNNPLIVRGGSVRIEAVSTGGLLNTIVEAGAHLTTRRLNQASLDLGPNSRVSVLPGGTQANVLTALELDPSATLDLANNDLIINGPADTKNILLTTLYNRLKSGYANGAWNGNGIASSTAHNITDTTLSLIDNAILGLTQFSGVAVDQNSLLLKYTYYGDIDQNGTVDADDLTVFANNFGRTSGATQVDGDVDFNGTVDADDLTVFANNFGKGSGMPLNGGSRGGLREADDEGPAAADRIRTNDEAILSFSASAPELQRSATARLRFADSVLAWSADEFRNLPIRKVRVKVT